MSAKRYSLLKFGLEFHLRALQYDGTNANEILEEFPGNLTYDEEKNELYLVDKTFSPVLVIPTDYLLQYDNDEFTFITSKETFEKYYFPENEK